MKSKKIIAFLVVVLMIFSISIPSFAANSTRTTDGIKKEDLIPALEEKLKEKEEETKNDEKDASESAEDESKKDTSKTETKKETEKKDESEEVEDVKKVYEDEISSDISILGSESDINYSSIAINGNVFIISDKDVSLKDCKIDGDIFVISETLTLKNVEVSGSVFVGGATKANMTIIANSVYAFGEEIEIAESSEIARELRVACETLKFNGYVGRDAYIAATNSNILDEAEIEGDCIIKAEKSEISEDAKIDGKTDVTIVKNTKITFKATLESYLKESITEIIIILVVAIFVLGGFPKFAEINNRLRLRDFVKSFLTGILAILVITIVVVGLCIWGHGVGYALALILLTGALLGIGKLIFVIAFAVRIGGKPEKISKLKVFFMTAFVAIAIEIIGLISLLGTVGMIINIVLNMIIGISGFGSLVKVILSPRNVKKSKAKEEKELKDVQDVIKAEENESVQAQVKEEVRKEIEEEMKAIQEEKNTEIEENNEVKPEEDDNNDENKE